VDSTHSKDWQMAFSALIQFINVSSIAPTRAIGKLLLALAMLFTLGSCQSNILTRVKESSATVVSGIKNLPANVFPSEFESRAYIDGDFSIPNASVEADGEYAVITTFFATNRSSDTAATAAHMFRDGRASNPSFGKSYVTLRRSGDTFDIEPDSLIKVDIVNPPTADATLSYNEVFTRKRLGSEVDSELNRSGTDSLLIYVHGFNMSFENAAIASAQLSYDIGFKGTTVFYSWPARGGASAYIADAESAAASQRQFEAMASELLYQTRATKVYLVAHSLGARLASRALKSVFQAEPGFRTKVKEIVLIAPDIETDEFISELAPFLGTVERPVTVYVSQSDPAIVISNTLNNTPIIGESMFVTRRVETIDAPAIDTSLRGHSSYSAADSILGDIWSLIEYNLRANSRNLLRAKYTQQGTYWEVIK
jgi:esterase/lipase superfamily enzyme